MVIDLERKFGTDAVPVRARANQLHPEHVVLIAVVVTEQPCRTIGLGNHQVQITVIVEVPVRRAPSYHWPFESRPQLGRHVFELTLSPIAKYQGWFRILQ